MTEELPVAEVIELMRAVDRITGQVVLKGCAPGLAHQTEEHMVVVRVRNSQEAWEAFAAFYRP